MKKYLGITLVTLLLAACSSVPTPPKTIPEPDVQPTATPHASPTPAPSATPVPAVEISKIPVKGEKSEDVKKLQAALNSKGAKLTVDGDFGSKTEAAISAFQKANGLAGSGVLGAQTVALLGLVVKAPPALDLEAALATLKATIDPAKGKPLVALDWEAKQSNAKKWGIFMYQTIDRLLDANFDKATDATRICSNYKSMSREEKVTTWSALVVGITKYESGYKPTSWMTETTMGTDPVTGKQVKSEGLLQLSYQDKQWAKYCQFDWSKDKALSQDDARKTIFNPYINLDCGLQIMADQIRKKGKIFLSSGVYWAVIKDGGKYGHVSEIIAQTRKQFPACKP